MEDSDSARWRMGEMEMGEMVRCAVVDKILVSTRWMPSISQTKYVFFFVVDSVRVQLSISAAT